MQKEVVREVSDPSALEKPAATSPTMNNTAEISFAERAIVEKMASDLSGRVILFLPA